MSDDQKKIVLARRAKFVAAAVASVGIACGKEQAEPPRPCLSQVYVPPDAEPQPCLSPVAVEPPDAATEDAAMPMPSDAATPVPCLSVAPPRKPPPTKK